MGLEGRELIKDGKIKFFFSDELADAKKQGWDETGSAKTVRTGSGDQAVQVSAAQLSELEEKDVRVADVAAGEREQLARAKIKEDTYDTAGNEALAAASGVGAGLTFGLSDYIIGEAGYADDLRNISEVNPWARGGGEAVGAVLGGFGGVARKGVLGAIGRYTPAGLASKGAAALGGRIGGVAGRVAEGATEGALFGGAQAVDSMYLADKPFSAEAVLAEAGSGALFGGALGGAVSLAGAGFSKLASKIDDVKLRKANPILDSGSDAQRRVVSALDDELRAASNVRAQAKALGAADDVTEAVQARVQKAIYTKNAPDIKKISKLTTDEWLGPVQPTGERAGGLLDDIVELEQSTKLLATETGQEYLPKFAAKADEIAAQEGAAIAPAADLAAMLEASDLSPIDASTIVEKATGSETAGAMVNLWAMARLAGKAGRGDASGFMRGLGGKTIGNLSRKPAGALGQLVGGMGSSVGRAKEAIGAGVGKFVKGLGRAASSKGAVPAVTTILGKVRFDPNVGEVPDKGNAFKLRSAELDRAMANPTATAERLRKKLAPISHVDPEVGAAMLQAGMNRLAFYNEKAPRNPLASMGLYRVGKWEPPASEVARFARYVKAGEDPLSLLDDMARGKITPEAVEAVKTLYPEMYSRIQLELVEQLAEPGAVEGLDYGQRVQLNIFFELPTDPTLTPDFYATMQDNYVRRDEAAQQGNQQYSTPGAVSKSPGLTEQPTAAQRIEQNG